jgi:hypothetical protein
MRWQFILVSTPFPLIVRFAVARAMNIRQVKAGILKRTGFLTHLAPFRLALRWRLGLDCKLDTTSDYHDFDECASSHSLYQSETSSYSTIYVAKKSTRHQSALIRSNLIHGCLDTYSCLFSYGLVQLKYTGCATERLVFELLSVCRHAAVSLHMSDRFKRSTRCIQTTVSILAKTGNTNQSS